METKEKLIRQIYKFFRVNADFDYIHEEKIINIKFYYRGYPVYITKKNYTYNDKIIYVVSDNHGDADYIRIERSYPHAYNNDYCDIDFTKDLQIIKQFIDNIINFNRNPIVNRKS